MTIKYLNCDLSPEVTTCLKMDEYTRTDCCPILQHIPYDAECFIGDIKKDLEKLYDRHKRMFTKSKRIMELAVPNNYWCPHVPKCACPFTKHIDVVHSDVPSYTRTEQLALPTTRRLLYRRRYAVQMGDKIGEGILNRLLRSSYLTMYSRLANAQPLKEPIKKKKRSKKAKAKSANYIAALAKPKVLVKPPRIPRKKGDFSEGRLRRLARPRVRLPDEKEPWHLTENQRTYKATERINKMAQPKEADNVHINTDPNKIAPNALSYKPSARIQEMATPLVVRDRTAVAADVKEDPFGISPNALKYKATTRIKELAEPKEFENTHIRENPFAISPAALKAKATPRLIELSKPKGA